MLRRWLDTPIIIREHDWMPRDRCFMMFLFEKLRIVFQNVFADIDANNIIALCSCLVFDEKSEDPITNNLDLMKAFETCKGIARNVAEIMVGDTQFVEFVAVAVERTNYINGLNSTWEIDDLSEGKQGWTRSCFVSQLELFSRCFAFELPELIVVACLFFHFHSLDVSNVIGGETKKKTQPHRIHGKGYIHQHYLIDLYGKLGPVNKNVALTPFVENRNPSMVGWNTNFSESLLKHRSRWITGLVWPFFWDGYISDPFKGIKGCWWPPFSGIKRSRLESPDFFTFTPNPGEMIQFDEHIFQSGLKRPRA